MGRSHTRFDSDVSDLDECDDYPIGKPNRRRSGRTQRLDNRAGRDATSRQRAGRADGSETFRCRHCKTMVGPTVSGGRHRNHCPVCLYSRHVDGRTPGDRRSDCRSLMAPVGLLVRRSGEQVLVHRCLGCGFERHNRVAADDNPLAVMRLPLVQSQPEPEEIVSLA